MTENEMVGWHHQLNGHEFEQTLGDDEGQGSLACYSPWGHKHSGTTERLSNNNSILYKIMSYKIKYTLQREMREKKIVLNTDRGKGFGD